MSTAARIAELSERLLAELSAPGAPERIGRIFGDHAGALRCYAAYASGHDESLGIIAAASKRSGAFAAFLAQCAEQTHGLTLQSFLIMPVQRVPRYPVFPLETDIPFGNAAL